MKNTGPGLVSSTSARTAGLIQGSGRSGRNLTWFSIAYIAGLTELVVRYKVVRVFGHVDFDHLAGFLEEADAV